MSSNITWSRLGRAKKSVGVKHQSLTIFLVFRINRCQSFFRLVVLYIKHIPYCLFIDHNASVRRIILGGFLIITEHL